MSVGIVAGAAGVEKHARCAVCMVPAAAAAAVAVGEVSHPQAQ